MNHIKEDWVIVNDFPTHVCTWGRWITDKDDHTGPVILLLSGNPGIIGFYYSFLEAIYKALALPVWILSHAGHEICPKDKCGSSSNNKCDSNNVVSQVEHKAEFIERYVPAGSDIYIIAHSFGAKITVELLKREAFRKRIKKCYLLFPTLQKIGSTRNGHKIKCFIKYLFSIIMFLSFIFSLFPYPMKWWLIKMYFTICGRRKVDSNCIKSVIDLINPTTLSNVFNLAGNEMDVIRELDKEIIEDCADKLHVYFGTSDDWAPLEHHYELIEQVPNIDSNILDSKYEHCFVLETAEELASEISECIRNDISCKR